MTGARDVPLVLGGHSFISQLGNEPAASEREQRAIVEACLNAGIKWFDTTYQPERVALGNTLQALGRRDEATIMAWNFFTDFSPTDPVGEPGYYRPRHIDVILEQLRTSYVDCLVVLPLADREENQRQEELLVEWQRKGYVRFLAIWVEGRPVGASHAANGPFRCAIQPFNVNTAAAAPAFAAYKRAGWETIATSPFVRGWELDTLIAEAAARELGDATTLRPRLADALLRYSLFETDVDRVIVAMRKVEWVKSNLESVLRGPLTKRERDWLESLKTKPRRWWQRLRVRS
jgi:aryl-alcohol dehydrogenase-like predicted oxidoreductase